MLQFPKLAEKGSTLMNFEKESSIVPHYVYAPVLVQRFQLFSFGISLLQFEMDDNLVYKNQQLERINQTTKEWISLN